MRKRAVAFRKNIINICILAALIGVTFFVIFNNKDGFSFGSVLDFVRDIHLPFLIGALLCMVMNIGFKGLSIGVLSRALGYRRSPPRNYAYASADIYFSAITPSATGGQPASAYYMVKDDIPISHTTAILSVNLFMYTASLIVLALITFLVRPSLFFNIESWVVKACIIIGLLVQLLLLSVYMMIMISEKAVIKLATWLVNILAFLHIVKHKREYLGRINASVTRFKNSVILLRNRKKALAASFLLNFAERITYISIGVLVFYGAMYNIPELAGNKVDVLDVYALEAYCWFGAYCVPLPGAVGASEAIFNSVFSMIISSNVLLGATMVTTRGINFYLMMIFAGVVTLIHHSRVKVSERKKSIAKQKTE